MKGKNKKVPAMLLSIMLICTMSGCRQEGNGKEAGTEEAADISRHAAASTVTLTEGKGGIPLSSVKKETMCFQERWQTGRLS